MIKVENFTLNDILKIGSFCEASLEIMVELWKKEYRKQKEKESIHMSTLKTQDRKVRSPDFHNHYL